MAKSSEEEQRQKRRRRLTRGLVLGAAAFGLPALYNAWMARRAQRLGTPAWGLAQPFASSQGRLAFRDLGVEASGTPFVLLHSLGPGHSSNHWESVARDLARRRRVITFDWPGWGESERLAQEYSQDRFLQCLDELVSFSLDEDSIHLVAAGLAAVPAVRLAGERPGLVERLTLVCPRGRTHQRPQTRDQVVGQLLRLPVVGTSAVHVATSRRVLENQLRRDFHDPSRIELRWLDEHERFSHLPGSAFALRAYLSGQLDGAVGALWRELRLPTHLIWGRHSVDPEVAEADPWLASKDSRLSVIENAGSLPHLEQPEAVLQALVTP